MYYSASIRTGAGVFFVDGDKKRMEHEIKNLFPGWTINIWIFKDNDVPVRKCNLDEFRTEDNNNE